MQNPVNVTGVNISYVAARHRRQHLTAGDKNMEENSVNTGFVGTTRVVAPHSHQSSPTRKIRSAVGNKCKPSSVEDNKGTIGIDGVWGSYVVSSQTTSPNTTTEEFAPNQIEQNGNINSFRGKKAIGIKISEKRKDEILSQIIQLELRLGGLAPGLLDLYCAGFSREEIHAVWNDLAWLYGSDWNTKGPVNVETLEQANQELEVYDQVAA
jgi:hypothetical protein